MYLDNDLLIPKKKKTMSKLFNYLEIFFSYTKLKQFQFHQKKV